MGWDGGTQRLNSSLVPGTAQVSHGCFPGSSGEETGEVPEMEAGLHLFPCDYLSIQSQLQPKGVGSCPPGKQGTKKSIHRET